MLRWSALTENVMEVRPLSLSRLQVLFHSLSKVLFKLSLTLLVRYRSSYSVFRALADTYLPLHTALPSSATRLSLSMRPWLLVQRATTDLGLNTPIKGWIQQGLLCTLNFTSPINHPQTANCATTRGI